MDDLIATCKKLAADMATCDRTTFVRCKRIINDGAGLNLDAALKYELFGMDLHSAGQSGETIAERRDSVMSRGRSADSDMA